jgi:hypothetical protein
MAAFLLMLAFLVDEGELADAEGALRTGVERAERSARSFESGSPSSANKPRRVSGASRFHGRYGTNSFTQEREQLSILPHAEIDVALKCAMRDTRSPAMRRFLHIAAAS